MNKRNLFAILLMLMISSAAAVADDALPNLKETQILPQTPNVAPMMEYVDRPVSYFAGTMSVPVPLCDLNIHGVPLPLSLTYSSTGLRPSQEASWVGLGWSFSLNACISRMVRCVDDFLEYPNSNYGRYEQGYYGLSNIPNDWTEISTTSPFIRYLYLTRSSATDLSYRTTYQIRDSEPDIFSMSLWNGSTKFVFNKNKEYYSVNPRDTAGIAIFSDMAAGWQLEVMVDNEAQDGPKHYFTAVSRDGIRYEFRKREFAYITSGCDTGTNPVSDHFSFSYEAVPYSKYTSSWFLTKITTVTGDTIGFEYQPEYYWAPSQSSIIKYTGMPGSYGIHQDNSEYMTGDCMALDDQPLYNWTQCQFLTYRLKSIKWDYGEIGFYTSFRNDVYHNTSGTRQDYDPEFHCNAVQKLDSIIVYQGRNGARKRVYGFGMEYGYFNENQSQNSYLYKRLRLDGVTNLMTGDHYSFTYQDGVFPSKQTNQLDYWGYYNGKNYGVAPYCLAYDDVAQVVRNGAVKYSDKRYCEIGMLRTVTHPTGGIETFDYELNTFNWHANLEPAAIINDHIELLYSSHIGSGNRPAYSDYLDIREDISLSIWGEYGSTNTNTAITYSPDSALWKLYKMVGQNKVLVRSYRHSNTSVPHNNRYNADSITLNLTAGRYFFYAGGVPDGGYHQWFRLGKKAITQNTFNEMVPMQGAGLRIARIEGGGKTRTFDYSDGKLLVEPIFSTKKNYWSLGYNEGYDAYSNQESDDIAIASEATDNTSAESDASAAASYRIVEANRRDASYFIQVSESIIPYSTLANGYIVGYETVAESCGNTTIVYKFKADEEMRISPNPYLSTNPVFSNGRLLSKTYKEGNNTLKVESYNWDEKKSAKIIGFNYDVNYGITDYSEFLWFTTDLLSSKNDIDQISTSISYIYNSKLQEQSHQQIENNIEYKTKTYYATDENDYTSRQMTQLNMLLPVRQYQMAGDRVVSGARIKYQYYGEPHAYLPSSYSELNIEAPIAESSISESDYEDRVTFLAYNAYGKPREIIRNGTHIVYLWSCMGEHPVAEIVNSTYNSMVSHLGYDPEQTLLRSLTPSESIISDLQALNSLPEVQVTTMTYMPLVGVTSMTGPTGKTQYFDYENGRLARKYYKNGTQEETIETYEYVISGN